MLSRWVLIASLQVLLCTGVWARDLPDDLRPLFEGFQAHRRVAIGYLRTQNIELGAVEIERARDRWTANRRAIAPATLTDPQLASALERTQALIADSLKSADAGDADAARRLIEQAAAPLDAWRKASGIRLFSDCIAEVTAAYERLDVFRLETPDLADAVVAGRITAAAAGTAESLMRCDREAPDALRREPDFRRLFDGMADSLRQIPDAVGARDTARFYRLLIEQRSFERLLAFRFG